MPVLHIHPNPFLYPGAKGGFPAALHLSAGAPPSLTPGVGLLAAGEGDVGVTEDGERLVAIVEALGEEAETGAVGAGVAVGEESDVGASVCWVGVGHLSGEIL